ncbi:sulfur carrier protein ThiS [Sulfurospirillum sp. 1307]|jgi:sulfur carrier protein
MKIIVNGKEKETNAQTVKELLNELSIKDKVMASAVNMEVIKKEQWDTWKLKDGDKVEFLEFVGGG